MRVTLEDIARLTNVSKATVSRVINGNEKGVGEETRKRILEAMERLDYRPNLLARGIASGKTRTIGIVVPDITSPFFPEVIRATGDYLHSEDYIALICNTNLSPKMEEACLASMIAKRVDGVILTSLFEEWQEIHERLNKYGIPCVLLDRKMKRMPVETGVFVDNEFSMFMATEMLIRGGHRRIGFIAGPQHASTTRERAQGYRAALEAYQIPYDDSLTYYGEFSIQCGYNAAMALMQDNQGCTALLAGNDTLAIGVLRALKTLRIRIPQDVEMIGFDRSQLTDVAEPPLSLIEQPTADLGEQVASLLFTLLRGEEPRERILRLESRILLRGTTRNVG